MKQFFISIVERILLGNRKITQEGLDNKRWERILSKRGKMKLPEIKVEVGEHVWLIPVIFEIEEKPELIEAVVSGYTIRTDFDYVEKGEVDAEMHIICQDKKGRDYNEEIDFETMYAYEHREDAQEMLDAEWDAYIYGE